MPNNLQNINKKKKLLPKLQQKESLGKNTKSRPNMMLHSLLKSQKQPLKMLLSCCAISTA